MGWSILETSSEESWALWLLDLLILDQVFQAGATQEADRQHFGIATFRE
jgi:hypothetical protein